ncbi:MAG: hypothetical protein IJX85_03210 [Lachnospiraceae bacterium]|nr:hypothetical protein [Lachnospiraceae bacterium]
MKSTCKKIVTDINRDKELEISIPKYLELLDSQYNMYSTVKLCLNFYTIREMLEDDSNIAEFKGDYYKLSSLLKKAISASCEVTDEDICAIDAIRNSVEYRMKLLTSYTDGFEIYEYILNRLEAGIKGTVEEVDTELLSNKMFQYVFSENDTVVVNSKLQILMSQLPVRMTKNKFYDVVANTLSIYKGGETSSVDEFADMLRTAVLITKPEGFETEYPDLYDVYARLEAADYKNLDEASFDRLVIDLNEGAQYITEQVSFYMLFQEVINDTYTMLLTSKGKTNNETSDSYKAAIRIIDTCLNSFSENSAEELMDSFMYLEGAQENVYENVMILETVLDDVAHKGQSMGDELTDYIKCLRTVEKLVSTSLFIDLKKASDSQSVIADGDYIGCLKEQLTQEFVEYFKDKSMIVVRSIMCKILATMPIFLDSQQEIKSYFDYVLDNCKNDSELTACNKLICDIIEEDV